ncbi:MAG: ATP-binding cassette domain-containing protein [Microbacteriaceae bacterium]|nr:ATP-binding cassette domain-containing protein [Microbacteriaceae bacterium]
MINLKNIHKFYGNPPDRVSALCDVTLNINQGDIFGIIGKSGAGKSTLLRTINLLEVPNSGEVIVDGLNLTQVSKARLRLQRRKIAMIFQHFNLLSGCTVFENIAFPLELEGMAKEEIAKKVNYLMEVVELGSKKNNYPAQLSGGQKQRVAIARALACEPKIILSDEATSALDNETTKSILNILKQVQKQFKVTIVLITHQIEVVKQICTRVALMDEGKMIEENDMVHFFATPKSALAKKLISSSFHIELPEYFLNKLKPHFFFGASPILKLIFYKESSGQPFISVVSIKFQIHINILQAHLDSICDEPLGIMICQLIGDQNNIDMALSYFKNHQIFLEVIGYVANNSTNNNSN